MAVLHPPTQPAVLGDRALEQHLYRLPRHARQAGVRHAVRVRSARDAGGPDDRRRVRDRLRVVPRPGEAHVRANAESAPPLRLHLTGASTRRTVQPTRLDRDTLLAGLRSVPRHVGVLRRRRRAAANSRRPALPSRRRALGDALRRAANRQRRSRRRCRRCSPTIPRFIRDSFWSDGIVRVSGREYNGLLESPCFSNATHADRTHVLLLVPHDAQDADDDRATARSVGRRSTRGPAWTGRTRPVCSATSRLRANVTAHTHHAAEVRRQLLLQLPHAVHDLRPAEDDSQPHGQQSDGAGESWRPVDRTPATCVTWTRRSTGRATRCEQWYRTPRRRAGRATSGRVAASLLWLLKGDAGQRAIVSQAMALAAGAAGLGD